MPKQLLRVLKVPSSTRSLYNLLIKATKNIHWSSFIYQIVDYVLFEHVKNEETQGKGKKKKKKKKTNRKKKKKHKKKEKHKTKKKEKLLEG